MTVADCLLDRAFSVGPTLLKLCRVQENTRSRWATEELVSADLGDVRRNQRLVAIVEDLAASPESSVPLASRDRAALQRMYAFWGNPRIKASSILTAHRDRAVERSECWDRVLAIQDTTELDYSAHRSKWGMGYWRGANTKGLLLRARVERDADRDRASADAGEKGAQNGMIAAVKRAKREPLPVFATQPPW